MGRRFTYCPRTYNQYTLSFSNDFNDRNIRYCFILSCLNVTKCQIFVSLFTNAKDLSITRTFHKVFSCKKFTKPVVSLNLQFKTHTFIITGNIYILNLMQVIFVRETSYCLKSCHKLLRNWKIL